MKTEQKLQIGFAITGSFCTHEKILTEIQKLLFQILIAIIL